MFLFCAVSVRYTLLVHNKQIPTGIRSHDADDSVKMTLLKDSKLSPEKY